MFAAALFKIQGPFHFLLLLFLLSELDFKGIFVFGCGGQSITIQIKVGKSRRREGKKPNRKLLRIRIQLCLKLWHQILSFFVCSQNMHQGSLKSAVRRSLTKSLLLPPDDSNEVVQSKATGKTRATAAIEFMSGKTNRGQDQIPSMGKEEEKVMAYRNSNDFQLLQVSREAQKLSEMIDSWSMTTNIHSRSQFFAEDLLRSALDLQESLDMLKKLQDATIQVNSKQKQEALGRRYEKIFVQGVTGNHRNRLHEHRISSDDLPRNGVELKEVIQESLYESNILSTSTDDDKCSSSRSMQYSERNIFKDSCLRNPVPDKSIYSIDQAKKARSPNVIAKLMGLEEARPKIIQPIRTEEKDCVNLPRPRFDIEMPKARKTQFLTQNDYQSQSKFDEMVEAVHFKGLLKQSQVEERGHEPPFLSATEVEQCGRSFHRADYLPPIVIMKPTHLLYQESNVHKELPRDKVVMSNIEECKLAQENYGSDYHKHMLAKIQNQEKKELKNINEITESLPNYHLSPSLYHKHRNAKVIVHKMNTGEQKPSNFDLKKQEKRGIKAARMATTNHKTSTVFVNKELPKARINMSTPHSQGLKSRFRTIPKEITGSTKDKNKPGTKPLNRSSIFDASIEGEHSNESGTAIRSKKSNDVPKATGSFNRTNLLVQVKQETKFWNPDNVTKDHKIFREATPKSGRREENCKLIEVIQLPDCKKVNGAVARNGDLKDTFLSSQSFLSYAKKFFGLDATLPIYYQRESSDGIMKLDPKLIIDLSGELMARKYQQKEHMIHPLQTQSSARVAYSSIDKLVDDIRIGITKLTHTSEGTLYIKLERDLMCKDTALNSAWDFGWDNRICLDEADQVAEEVGRQILSRLIEEAALELIKTACLLDY